MLTIPNLIFLQDLKAELLSNQDFLAYQQQIQDTPRDHPDCIICQDLIMQKGHIWLPKRLPAIQIILAEFHFTPTGGHIGVAKTLARVGKNFI